MDYKKFMDKLTERVGREDDEYHNGPDPVKHTYNFKVSKDGAEPHHRSVTTPMTRKPKHELEHLARAHLEKQGYKIHESVNEEHLVHVNDGSNYGDKPHPKDVEHVMAGAKKHNGEHDGNSDKGAFFKFKSHSDAKNFAAHVGHAPHKSVYADLHEGLDIIPRADYKLDKAGKKSHKEIVFHNGDGSQEKDDKLKREEVEMQEEKMTDDQMKERERIVKGMKKGIAGFKARYGVKAKSVMYATATKNAMKEEVENIEEAMNDNLHPAGAALLKHIKPEHHNKYKPFLTTDTFNGSHKDRTDVLNAAKKAGHLKEESVTEAKDEQEYGYEGDMAMNQLETAIRHATYLKDMMKPETDLPEWVQSKITLATDYLQTACDYMTSEMNEALKGGQVKLDKNKNGKLDAHDFKLLRKEEAIDEAMINGREYASHGLMHPTHAAHAVHKVTGSTIDFYAHGSGDKVSGKVTKNDGKAVHIKDTSGKTHQFKVTPHLPKQQNEELDFVDEQAPVAPVPDRKYIKGTPENKALKASRKPINGMPTKVKEGTNFDEEGTLMAEKKTYSQFVEQLLEYESDSSGKYVHTKGSYGKSYDSEEDDKPKKAEPSTVKRGRGRPAGAKSGANQKVSSGKSYGGIATHTLNLPK